jgi:uncharacterized membrane-anchored protein YhcB (DUF1043 family)
LKESVKSAHKRLLELIKNEKDLSNNGLDLHLVGILIQDGQAYLCKMGSPEVILVRESKLVNISDSLPGYSGGGLKEEIPVGLFDLRKSDIFLFSTPQLAESVMDLFTDAQETSWSLLISQLDVFSEGLVGAQYIWIIGYRIDETPKTEIPDVAKISDTTPSFDAPTIDNVNNIEVHVDESPSKQKSDAGLGSSISVKDTVGKLFSGIKSWIQNIDMPAVKRSFGSKISSLKMGNVRNKRKKMFIDKGSGLSFGNRNNKKKIIGGGIIVIIIIGIFLIVRSQRLRVINEEIQGELDNISEDLDEAENLWQSDKMQAGEIIDRVFEDLDSLEDEKLNPDQKDSLGDLEDQAQNIYDNIHRIVALSEENNNFEILFDAYLDIDESVEIADMAILDNLLYLVDSSTHGVYEYVIGGESIKAVADSQDQLKEPVLIAIGEQYMFVYDNKIGMLSLDLEADEADQTFDSMPELSARTIEEATSIDAFGDNIYILKSSEARVLKSYPAGTGYSYPEEYFRHGALDKSTDLLIDGNIYVISNSSDIVYKFYGGDQDQFTLTEIDENFDGVGCGFTNLSDSRPLYIFDTGNKRIVEIEKGTSEKHPGEGVMTSQYIYRGERKDVFDDVREIVVDGDEKYMYVLDGTRVLRIML